MVRRAFHFRQFVPTARGERHLHFSGLPNRIGHGGLAGRNAETLGSDEGAALVEAALAVVVLFALLFGVFEFSMASYTYHYTAEAARQGSRWAMVRGSQCQTDLPNATSSYHCDAQEPDISDYVKSLGYPGIDSTQMTITVSTCPAKPTTDANGNPTMTWGTCVKGTTNNAPGDEVLINVSYNFPLSIPFWKQETLTISSQSNMVYTQ